MGIIDSPDIHFDSAISFNVLIILHEHFNILGHFCLTEQWRSVAVSSSEILTSLIGTFNYMDFTIKTQVGCNYLCQPTTLLKNLTML